MQLKDILGIDSFESDCLIVKFESQDCEKRLKDILEIMDKFSIETELLPDARKILEDHFREEKDFEKFSREAYDIRNNQLESRKDDFERFTDVLERCLTDRKLYGRQLLSSYHLAFSQNACNFSVPGSGKTSIVYGAYAYLRHLPADNPKQVDKLLIVGPLNSFGPWESEYMECFGKEPQSKRLSGGVSREERVNHFYSSDPAEISLISYNAAVNMIEDVSYFLKKHKTMMVLDEAHKIKNTKGGITADSVLRLAKYCRARVVLTGTPAPNGYEDIYNLFKFIYPMRNVLGLHLFQLEDMSSNRRDTRVDQLIHSVSPYFLRITKEDLKLPRPIENDPIIVKMGPVQKKIYNFIEKKYMDYFTRQGREKTSSLNNHLARARIIRLMQASTNPALLQRPLDAFLQEQGISDDKFIDDTEIIRYISSYGNIETPEKFIVAGKLVKDIIDKGEKVVVWAIFIQNINEFSKYLLSNGIMAKELYGATPVEQDDDDLEDLETRESIIRNFHKDDSAFKVIIANPFAVSESISLHKVCHNAVYLEKSFNVAHFIQSKDRIHRYGLKRDDRINYYYLLSDNNIDRTVHERLGAKERRMLEIIENDPIPLFGRLDESAELDDIQILINNYVNRVVKI